jgi:hypothetical protein
MSQTPGTFLTGGWPSTAVPVPAQIKVSAAQVPTWRLLRCVSEES